MIKSQKISIILVLISIFIIGVNISIMTVYMLLDYSHLYLGYIMSNRLMYSLINIYYIIFQVAEILFYISLLIYTTYYQKNKPKMKHEEIIFSNNFKYTFIIVIVLCIIFNLINIISLIFLEQSFLISVLFTKVVLIVKVLRMLITVLFYGLFVALCFKIYNSQKFNKPIFFKGILLFGSSISILYSLWDLVAMILYENTYVVYTGQFLILNRIVNFTNFFGVILVCMCLLVLLLSEASINDKNSEEIEYFN